MTIDKSRTKAPKGTLPAFAPVPRHSNRHDGWTPERQRNFIEALADTGSVKSAAHAVNMTPEGAYQLRRHPEAGEFRKAWEAALALGVQRIEDVAMDRALNGVEVPVYHFGEVVGWRTVYNDYLLMFLLRNRAPKRFGADNARGMSAVDQAMLRRLKKQWFAEWEAARQQQEEEDEDAILASLDAKIEAMRAREEEAARLLALEDLREEGEDEEESDRRF
ncbi:MAG: hypothetical protein J7496_11340 [Novosphingobium sp.]|nr:hypothetical protein [Novosphingobium sp.]MBO9603086.1 hypothetical protein [Novosphingobium sp.]